MLVAVLVLATSQWTGWSYWAGTALAAAVYAFLWIRWSIIEIEKAKYRLHKTEERLGALDGKPRDPGDWRREDPWS